MKNNNGLLVELLFGFSALLTFFAAWITHIVVCLKTASWGFLIAGAIFAPIGVIHGLLIWLGIL